MKNLTRSLLVIFTLISANSQAELIQWDAFDSGDNLAVKDSTSGLVWLDLTMTSHMSYRQAGGAFAGWEYASALDVWGLLDTAFSDIQLIRHDTQEPLNYERNCANSTLCYAQANQWQSLFGATQGSRYYQTYAFGLYQGESLRIRMGGSYVNGSALANIYGRTFDQAHNDQLDQSNNLYGTFLVQSTLNTNADHAISVPTPSSLIALCLPFILILTGKRKLNC
ncbi:hypothetical protein [uncultured Paraglaciecola sp.]|uniref:hypothetical protein n=1 Tax=uncultured Paraglaciecola sp. TaxID=1765024 RepID=UPI0030D84FFE|tara:strand:- start:7744 stop:8415 length:672 start_codon:yes stop_codon:yes gene_type:complete